jgi:hypothetical protein
MPLTLLRHPRTRGLRDGVFATVLSLLAGTLVAAEPWDWQGVDRIVAVGDVHGDYDNYIKVLEQAGLIDQRGRWMGGSTHLVQLGDVPDRGPDTHRIIEHLMSLEKQARRAGGRVHALIGNHEAMNSLGDLRYVHPGEYEALKSRRASSLREDYYERVVDFLKSKDDAPDIDAAFREAWLAEHPLGYVEHRKHWRPGGRFGDWIGGHNALVRINRTLFLHAGLSPEMLGMSLEDMNEAIRSDLNATDGSPALLAESELGPLWYRGLSRGEETPEMAAHLGALLERYDVDRLVLGHTPGYATVVPRFDSRVLVADTGIGDYYGGHLASLLIEGGKLFTIQRGHRVPIPDSNAGRLAYYRAINEIEPGVNNLQFMIQRLEQEASKRDSEGEIVKPR